MPREAIVRCESGRGKAQYAEATPWRIVPEPILFQPMGQLMRVITLTMQVSKLRLREVQTEAALGHTPTES